MPSRLAGLLVAVAMAVGGFPASAGGMTIWIRLCHGGAIPLNLPTDGRNDPAKQCPAGCHAACLGRRQEMAEGAG